jgi:hypothetical protein
MKYSWQETIVTQRQSCCPRLRDDISRPRKIRDTAGVFRSRGSSGDIVSDYGLDDREIGVRSSAGAKYFSSSLCVQTGSEAHPASCTMGTGGPFPGAKRGWGVTLTTHPYLVPRSPWRVAGLFCFAL